MAGYDPGTAHDRTGEAFQNPLRPRDRGRLRDALKAFTNPEAVVCPECRSESWRLIADNAGDSALALTQCTKCGAFCRPFEMRVPQMNDEMARKLGLWTPPSVEAYIDVERD